MKTLKEAKQAIEALEKRIAELERRPQYVPYPAIAPPPWGPPTLGPYIVSSTGSDWPQN